MMCDHNPNSSSSSLKLTKFRTMTYPEVRYYECEECGEFVEVESSTDGQCKGLKEKKEDLTVEVETNERTS